MTTLEEAVQRYHRILESDAHKDLAWANELRDRMLNEKLTIGGRVACPFLRPNFITRRQLQTVAKATQALLSAIERMGRVVLENPPLLSRMDLLPAERMLATIEPGYSAGLINSMLDLQVTNGSLHVLEHNVNTPAGVAFDDGLASLFYDAAPVREFRKWRRLTKFGGIKHLLSALAAAYKEFGGKRRPRIGILEFRQPFQTSTPSEYLLLCEAFVKAGFPAQIVTPEQLDYRNGKLRAENFEIDVIYRLVRIHEFLLRYDLSHPLLRAYRDRAVCVVSSFRSEMAHKRSLFDLLTDDSVTSSFPAAERKAIREYIPWTRLVGMTKTTYNDQTVDLPEFIRRNRERLVLKPNQDSSELHPLPGWETDESSWERALHRALRLPYVVQERVEPARALFPVYSFAGLQMKEMRVDVHPHVYMGRLQSCSSWLSAATNGTFSTLAGLAPTFILEAR